MTVFKKVLFGFLRAIQIQIGTKFFLNCSKDKVMKRFVFPPKREVFADKQSQIS